MIGVSHEERADGPIIPQPPARGGRPRKELRGVVERLTYHTPENGDTVARLARERPRDEARAAQGDDRLVTVVGTLADLTPGEAIVAHGWWTNDPKHGWQFRVLDYRTSLPATTLGMRRYLGSGLVKGVGPVMAGRIVDAFGEGTFDVIDATPDRLTEVRGIGKVRAGRIAATWVEQRHIREVMAALQGYGVSTSLAVRIDKRFGDDSGRVVAQEPYRLAREIWGIGFRTADTIAQAVGIALDAPERLQAGVLHAMGTAGDDGHTLLPERELVETAAELPQIDADRLGPPVEALLATGDLVAAHRADTTLRLVALSAPKPKVAGETIALIRELAATHRLWGADRIRGELLKLDIRVSKRTIQRYLRQARPPRRSGQAWSTFLRNRAGEIWACDSLPVTDLLFRPLHAFFLIALESRRVVHVGVTRHPTDAWVAQQLREATPFGQRPIFLLRDNDSKYGAAFTRLAAASGIRVLRTPGRAPRANATRERFLGSVRRECLDHSLILSEAHLRRALNAYVAYFNDARPHQGFGQAIPARSVPVACECVGQGRIVALPVLNGLHHDYRRVA